MKFFQTTRMQIWLGSVSVMLVVLFITSSLAFSVMSALLEDSADNYANEIANQANGRLEALLNQMDTITLQVTMDPQVQNILYKLEKGQPISLDEQINLRYPLIRLSSLMPVVQSIDVYSKNEAVYPVDNQLLEKRISPDWIAEADRNTGKLVWIGLDSNDKESIIGIRQIRLESDNYTGGGYVIITASSSLLDFLGQTVARIEGSAMYLLNANQEIVTSRKDGNLELPLEVLTGNENQVSVNGRNLKLIKQQAKIDQWSLVMLIPKDKILEGVSKLQHMYWQIGAAGILLFAVISFLLTLLVTKPIRKMIRVIKGNRLGVFHKNPAVYFNREINELNYSYNRMVDNINELIEEGYKQQIAHMSLEIKALHSQINPHFLYNTLEAFYWLLIQKGEDHLASKVISLSNVFRYVVKQEKSEQDMVLLQTEMDHVISYLEIMTMRMGNRLTWRQQVDRPALKCQIPKLIIQPIVENAILHGIEPKIGDGEVDIRIRIDDETRDLIIEISDTGIGLQIDEVRNINLKLQSGEQPEGKRTGIGLHNINRRIQLYYGAESSLRISSQYGQGTKVTMRLTNVMTKEEGE